MRTDARQCGPRRAIAQLASATELAAVCSAGLRGKGVR
jgi:hypothetical protein